MNLRIHILGLIVLAAMTAAPRAHALLEQPPDPNAEMPRLPNELERGDMLTHQRFDMHSYRDDISDRVTAQRRPESIALEDSKRLHEERLQEVPVTESTWTSPWFWTFMTALAVLALVAYYWIRKQQAAMYSGRSARTVRAR